MSSDSPSIRDVDPAEAATDVSVRYAMDVMERVRRGEGGFVPHNPDRIREPKDRSSVIGSLLHGAICRTGGCDATGSHSSIAYDHDFDGGAHAAWVDAWPMLVAELRDHTRVICGDLEFHQPLAIDGGDTPVPLDDASIASRIALVMHRHCDNPALMPAGCRAPGAALCGEATRVGGLTAWWITNYKIAFFPADRTDLIRQENLEERRALIRARVRAEFDARLAAERSAAES